MMTSFSKSLKKFIFFKVSKISGVANSPTTEYLYNLLLINHHSTNELNSILLLKEGKEKILNKIRSYWKKCNSQFNIHTHEDRDYLLQDRVLNDTLLSAIKHESLMHFMYMCLYSMFTISYSKHHTKEKNPKQTAVCKLGLSSIDLSQFRTVWGSFSHFQ